MTTQKSQAEIEWERVMHYGANELGDELREALGHIDDLNASIEVYKTTVGACRADLAVAREMLAAIAAKEAAEAESKQARFAVALASQGLEAAESREHALGVQVVALQKRLALFEEGAALLRDVVDDCEGSSEHYYRVQKSTIDIGVGCFLAKVDAVPGDALSVPPQLGFFACRCDLVGCPDCDHRKAAPTVDYREAGGVDVERVSRVAISAARQRDLERGVFCQGCGRMVGLEGCYEHGLEQIVPAYDGDDEVTP